MSANLGHLRLDCCDCRDTALDSVLQQRPKAISNIEQNVATRGKYSSSQMTIMRIVPDRKNCASEKFGHYFLKIQ